MKYYIWSIIAIVTIVTIGGFLVVGSPQTERLRRFDDTRVSNLQFIQSELVNYWMNKSKLPAQLSDLQDSIRGLYLPKDPATNTDYEYQVTGPLSFTLCATFALPTTGNTTAKNAPAAPMPAGLYYDGIDQNWQHAAGRVCFDRTIDKDFYKPVPAVKK